MAPTAEKALAAMSGGVDSSVAAALLVEAGYDVTGVFLCLGSSAVKDRVDGGCCSPQDAADARSVADALGIDLFVLDAGEAFGKVIDYFVSEYVSGRTPNPCIRCNTTVKFERLFHLADQVGARYVSTGHYARITKDADGRPALCRGRAHSKDQSYVLFELQRSYLSRLLLPIGDLASKDHVRKTAEVKGLRVHDKPDSQEVCFVPDGDYTRLLAERAPRALRPGRIVNVHGETLGSHDGYARFTVGQRKGLGIAAGTPMYVTHVDPETATVTVGDSESVLASYLSATGAHWQCDTPEVFDADIQIRYNHRGAPGRVRITGEATFDVEFFEPVSAIAPGQAAVVYDDDRLLGGGWIASTCRN